MLEQVKLQPGVQDSRIWMWNKGKDFSVRTCFVGISSYPNYFCPSEKIWNTIWPQKVAFFMWTVYKHKILTYDKLMVRGRIGPNDAKLAWCNPRKMASAIEGWGSINTLSRRVKLIYSLVPSAICWTLWKERNNRIFEDKIQPVETVINQVKVNVPLWAEGSEEMKGLAIENVIVNWKTVIFEPP
ncbi:Reverse transcriptase zinc-binding domain [Macleaya cordata]|uniref:Reverse transcriptase zinc-binding domain n=1 Tax=Macleaya cordata TaxID=56857 RepID=A0A200QG26_MACCD|nr:Reverse transcriptase zinc-binding domain [Macleaya cordata]